MMTLRLALSLETSTQALLSAFPIWCASELAKDVERVCVCLCVCVWGGGGGLPRLSCSLLSYITRANFNLQAIWKQKGKMHTFKSVIASSGLPRM